MEPLKSTDVYCNPLMGRFQINISWCCYLLVCFLITICVRALSSIFKARAFKYEGETGDCNSTDPETRQQYWHICWKYFISFKFRKHSDLLLPTLIGFIELVSYPILFVVGQYLFIGAWLGIKTAGAWQGWRTSPTAYNRFLFFNMLNLLAAYLLLSRFVQRLPCP